MRHNPRPKDSKPKGLHPVWRGIGFILIVVVFGGSYWASSVLLDLNRTKGWVMPNAVAQLQYMLIHQVPFVGAYILPVGFALLISIFVYALIVILYGAVRGPVTGPYDVRGPTKKRRDRPNIRKCR